MVYFVHLMRRATQFECHLKMNPTELEWKTEQFCVFWFPPEFWWAIPYYVKMKPKFEPESQRSWPSTGAARQYFYPSNKGGK